MTPSVNPENRKRYIGSRFNVLLDARFIYINVRDCPQSVVNGVLCTTTVKGAPVVGERIWIH